MSFGVVSRCHGNCMALVQGVSRCWASPELFSQGSADQEAAHASTSHYPRSCKGVGDAKQAAKFIIISFLFPQVVLGVQRWS